MTSGSWPKYITYSQWNSKQRNVCVCKQFSGHIFQSSEESTTRGEGFLTHVNKVQIRNTSLRGDQLHFSRFRLTLRESLWIMGEQKGKSYKRKEFLQGNSKCLENYKDGNRIIHCHHLSWMCEFYPVLDVLINIRTCGQYGCEFHIAKDVSVNVNNRTRTSRDEDSPCSRNLTHLLPSRCGAPKTFTSRAFVTEKPIRCRSWR